MILKDELDEVADVDQVAVYHNCDVDTLPESVVERLGDGTIDWITLTSPAIAARLHGLLPDELRRAHRETNSARQPEPGDHAGRAVGWLGDRRRSGGIHVGGSGPGDRGAGKARAQDIVMIGVTETADRIFQRYKG